MWYVAHVPSDFYVNQQLVTIFNKSPFEFTDECQVNIHGSFFSQKRILAVRKKTPSSSFTCHWLVTRNLRNDKAEIFLRYLLR